DYRLLPGNRPLLNALTLPTRVYQGAGIGTAVDDGLLCLQAPRLADTAYAQLAREVLAHSRVPVLLDRSPALVAELGAAGLYWSAARMAAVQCRPVPGQYLFAGGADNASALQAACDAGADFAVLTLPQAGFDWPAWQRLRADVGLPVYAAGGSAAVAMARRHNAQGAAIAASASGCA